jgi:integrase
VNLKDKKHRREPFRVPLSSRAGNILEDMAAGRISDYVFPGATGKPLSNMSTLVLLRRMSSGNQQWLDPTCGKPIVPHGFRASFRTWCEEAARFPHAVVEEAMGHVVGTAVERAYRRTDVLEQRRALMEQWAAHCEPHSTGNVLKFARSNVHS